MASPSLFEQIGGEPRLRSIIGHFVARLMQDPMIGFFFQRVSRQRLEDKEYEHAAAHLGGPVEYTGRPIDEAHARHPILGGHFLRRQRILEQTLRDYDVPEPIIAHWLGEMERLRPEVTRDESGHCDPTKARALPIDGGGRRA